MQLVFFLNGSKKFPQRLSSRPHRCSPWQTAPLDGKPTVSATKSTGCITAALFCHSLEIKTSDSRGCNTPQLRNMWHRRICPQPMTFLRSWRTLRGNCRTQSSRDCTACLQSAPLHPLWKHDGDGSRCVTPDGSRWGDSTIWRRGKPRLDVRERLAKKRKCQISWKNSVT